LQLGAPFKTDFGITITIDRIAASDNIVLMIVLQQD
jgi:hypothetical protein